MTDRATSETADQARFRHMHDIAGQYHLHYSLVRTTATCVYVSMGILSGAILLVNEKTVGRFFPSILTIIIFITTILFNHVFSRWSRACRHLERYYEAKMNSNDNYVAAQDGFRHLFRHLVMKHSKDMPTSITSIGPVRQNSVDMFEFAIIVFGSLYSCLYVLTLLYSL